MIKLHNLPKIIDKRKKRVGRGKGSDKGKTSGRGMDGQRGREKVRPGFEGGQTRLIQRLPKMRGKAFKGGSREKEIVNVKQLQAKYADGERVSRDSLRARGLVDDPNAEVKILGAGKLDKKLVLSAGLSISSKAREKIESAGGEVVKIR